MFVCLGWGSLIWDPRTLPVSSAWRHDGPMLPIEFARQSQDGRITLVVTPGAPELKVLSADLNVPDIGTARRELASREGTQNGPIGYWCPAGTSNHEYAQAIGQWAQEVGHEGVVWTALQPKFEGGNVTPSGEQVLAYLAGLTGEVRAESEKYVRRTPAVITTPYRALIEARLGWIPSS